jgi:methylmalonyl-CoA mutase
MHQMNELALGREFEDATREQWLLLVGKALKGGDFEKKLVSRTYDGVRLQPLYTRDDARSADMATRGAVRAGPWSIGQLYAGADPATMNAAIREDLDGGVSQLDLQFSSPGQFGLPIGEDAIRAILNGVRPDWTGISLSAGEQFLTAAQATLAVLPSLSPEWSKGELDLGADPLGAFAAAGGLDVDRAGAQKSLAEIVRLAAAHPNVRAVRVDGRVYHEAGASEAQELAAMAATLATYLRWLDAEGVAIADALARTTIALSADASIFPTIAKLRAARRIVSRIAEASGAGASAVQRLTVTTSARMMAQRDAYTNMLRTTVACAGAAMGGADAITVLPFSWALGQPDAFARRMARNTQVVLMEESNLGRVTDPVGGSWYVEQLTDEIARKAWALFQDIEKQGSGEDRGLLASLQEGHIQRQLADTMAQRTKNLAMGREELIGVANFPNLNEQSFDAQPHSPVEDDRDPAMACEPLLAIRLAQPFEALRDVADAHTARAGKRPTVFLANLGSIPEFNARAAFAQNFFAAGGMAVATNDGFTNSADAARAFAESGAAAACICSSDENYKMLAESTAQALKAAGAREIYLAGRPGEQLDVYRAAGVSGFIYMGCDAIEALRSAHERLGVTAA